MQAPTNENLNFALKKRAALLSLIIGLLIFGVKIIAYLLTGSSAIFSDAAESVVHIMATAMALYSIILSSKPADESHLYGHGNIEYFSAGIEGTLIIVAAVTIIYKSIITIYSGIHPKSLDFGTILIGFAGVVNLILGFYLIDKGKKTNSITLVADGKHVLTDSFTSIGIVVGLTLVVFTRFYLFDPIIALIVALNIIVTGVKLIRQSIGGLMNETDRELLKQIVQLLNKIRKPYWIDLHHLRFWTSGDKVYIDFHLSIPHYFSIRESHLEEDFIRNELEKEISNTDVRIHFDYCDEILCQFCDYADCKVRLKDKSEDLIWTIEKAIGNPVNK